MISIESLSNMDRRQRITTILIIKKEHAASCEWNCSAIGKNVEDEHLKEPEAH